MQGSPPYNLSQGVPAGGTYSGTGVIGSSFHPTLSGTGSFVVTYSITDINGCVFSDSSIIEVVDPNSTEEIGLNWRIYPNPADESIRLEGVSVPSELEIYDATGRPVLTLRTYENGNPIHLKSMATGVYHLRAQGKVIRFVKN